MSFVQVSLLSGQRYSKWPYGVNPTSRKTPETFSAEIEQFTLEFIGNMETQNSKNNLEKEARSGRTRIFCLQKLRQSCGDPCALRTFRPKDQKSQPGNKCPEQGRGCQDHPTGKGGCLPQRGCENWISTCRRRNLAPSLTADAKTSSKWVRNLNIKAQTGVPVVAQPN